MPKASDTLTDAQRAQLRALDVSEPDTHDSPEAPAESWRAVPGYQARQSMYRPRKEAISLRLDMDVLDWLRRLGPGYQTTINRILRECMQATPTPPDPE